MSPVLAPVFLSVLPAAMKVALAAAAVLTVVSASWIVLQLVLQRRRAFGARLAAAVRAGDPAELERLMGAEAPRSLDALREVLDELQRLLLRGTDVLQEREREVERQRSRVACHPIPTVILDARGFVTYGNAAACELLECTAEELDDQPLEALFVTTPPLEAGRGERLVAAVAGSRAAAQLRYVAREGEEPLPVVTFLSSIFDAEGEAVEAVCSLLDVSRVGPPGRIGEDGPRLRPRERARRLPGDVACALNDSMTTIVGHSAILRERHPEDPDTLRSVTEIEQATERVREYAARLVSSARPERGSSSTPEELPGPLEHDDALPDVPALRPARICVVEDDPAVRSLVVSVLAREDLEILEAGDAEEALRLFRECKGRIDLLVTDVNMPRMKGNALYERLLCEQPGLRVLYISGYIDRELFRSEQPRDHEFLQKPFSPRELCLRVDQALRRA